MRPGRVAQLYPTMRGRALPIVSVSPEGIEMDALLAGAHPPALLQDRMLPAENCPRIWNGYLMV